MTSTRRHLKVGDIILIALTLGLVIFFSARVLFSGPAVDHVQITGQNTQALYSLEENRSVEVDGPLGTTEVIIAGGEVWIRSSPCREKICMKMGHISRCGEQLICIPNSVVVELVGEEGRIDGVSR
jgi:hypothetical protein